MCTTVLLIKVSTISKTKFCGIKTFINKDKTLNDEDGIEIVIDGIRYINFITKKTLEKIPYFKNGCMSGLYGDKIPEIPLKSSPVSSILFLTYLQNNDKFLKICNKLKFHLSPKDDVIVKTIELLNFLLIKVDYLIFSKMIIISKHNLANEILQLPPQISDIYYELILNTECSGEFIRTFTESAMSSMKTNSESSLSWLKKLSEHKKHTVLFD